MVFRHDTSTGREVEMRGQKAGCKTQKQERGSYWLLAPEQSVMKNYYVRTYS